MKKSFAVLGAGMQGTAAAYDLARFAQPKKILMADVSLKQAEHNAWRVNDLVGSAVCEPILADALSPVSLESVLHNADVVLSCLPYWMHPHVAAVALKTQTSMVDLGGNTEVSMQTLKLDDQARKAGLSFVPDTGLAPGLVNSLGCYLIESLDEVESIRLYCGVLPQNPKPPFNYKLTFNVEGLVTEYDYKATILREGHVQLVDTLSELEELCVEGLGDMEAFTTSGGTSTAPYTFEGQVANYEYKTIRYPGHCEKMRLYKDFGFWSEEVVEIKGAQVRPKDLFCAVFGEALSRYEDKDLCVVRAVGVGTLGGQSKRIQMDILDKECETTGFTAMERLTGFSCSIIAQEIAHGNVPEGAIRYEKAVSGKRFVEEIRRRDIQIKVKES